jgi:hypothetical protein
MLSELSRLLLLSSLDGFYYPLALFPLYLALGPWCLAELIRNRELQLVFAPCECFL